MRRVTIIAHELRGLLPVGGMGTATTFLALALARMGHSVEILLGVMHRPESIDPYWDELYREAGIEIRAAPPAGEPVEPWPFLRARSIELGLRQNPPDVVVVHDLGAPAYTALRLRQLDLAFQDTLFVVFCHGTRRWVLDMSRQLHVPDLEHVLAVNVLERMSLELADVVVSPSAYLVQWMRDQRWHLPEQTLVIPYMTRSAALGIEPPRRTATARDEPVRRIAFFGRLEEKKGLKPFAAGLNLLEPELLGHIDIEFVGKQTATWTRERVEQLLSDETRSALRGIAFEGELDQGEALARLSRPGTLAVTPSLGDNSPNTVYECIEYGVPLVASNVGGIPELIAAEDRERVLFEPTPQGIAQTLRRVLAAGHGFRPPRPAFDGADSYSRWGEVVELRPPHRAAAAVARADAVIGSRSEPDDGTAPYVVLLDGDDVPEPELVETLLRAQAASGADVVTCGVWLVGAGGERTLHLFSGEPDGLGVLANGYGTAALIRRETLAEARQQDAAWPLLARVAASGARIVSIPTPLVTRRAPVEDDPSDALLVAQELERALPEPLRALARLTAGLAAEARSTDESAGQPIPLLRRVAAAVRRLSGTGR